MNARDKAGLTQLLWASVGGHLKVVEALLAAKADVNKRNKDRWTPLYSASYNGHLEVMKALLAAEEEVNKSRKDVLSLHYTRHPVRGT